MSRASDRAAAVLFDMDGLLVDSEPVWYDVETELAGRLGGTWGREHQARCLGGTLRSTAEYIASYTGTARPVAELMDDLMAGMGRRLAQSVPLMPGALDLIDAVRVRGARTALVTSTYRSLAEAVLAAIGAERFDVTVAGDEVQAGKPDPAPYVLACDRLGVDPGRCVVLEDSPNGVRAGSAAGCYVVAVPSGPPVPAVLRLSVCSSLADIDADWLLRLPVEEAA